MYYSDPDMDSFMICIDDEEAADISEEHRSAYYGYGRADRGASTINEEDRYNGYGRADRVASTINEEDRLGGYRGYGSDRSASTTNEGDI